MLKMKMMRKSWIFLVLVLFSTPLLSGQNLSTYRKFSLGASLASISKQVGQDPGQAKLIHQSPAVIQQLTYWPIPTSLYASRAQSVSQILFSFYDGELYKIAVTYDGEATQGLTDDDMVQAISARYGTAKRFYPEIKLPTNDEYAPKETAIARWEDSGTSVDLSRSDSLNSFELTVFSNSLETKAEAAIVEALNLEKQEAPQKEVDRQKSEADKLEVARQKNIKAFRF
jgi:hypothetical protein